MPEIKDKEKLLKLYEKVLYELMSKKCINNMFQVILSKYNLDKHYGRYLFLPTEISPLLKFSHFLWMPQADYYMDRFNSQFEGLRKRARRPQEQADIKKLKCGDNINFDLSFNKLKKIYFSRPLVMSDLLERCLSEQKTARAESLLYNSIYTANNENANQLDWHVGVFLENQLLIGDNGYYLCVFFTNSSNKDYIFCIGAFCTMATCRRIQDEILKILKDAEDIHLLDDYSEEELNELKKKMDLAFANKRNETIKDIQEETIKWIESAIKSNKYDKEEIVQLNSIKRNIQINEDYEKIDKIRQYVKGIGEKLLPAVKIKEFAELIS